MPEDAPRTLPPRNLALDLVRVTEAAAMAAGRWVGKGDKESADKAAVDAMRLVLSSVEMDGVVVIGEGEKDAAPMLYNGEHVGSGHAPEVDVAVDPIDGTTLTSLGRPNALSVISVAERGSMFDPGPCVYMEKIAVGPEAAGVIDIDAPATANLKWIAKAKGESVSDITVVILERPRHDALIKEVREAGARITLIPDGDVAGALMTAWGPTGVDVLLGIGGTPEGVIAACALKSLGGEMQGRLWPRNEDEREAALERGYDLEKVLKTDELCAGSDVFFAATGITDGVFLEGVTYRGGTAHTHSMVMRSASGTVRTIHSDHRLGKLREISVVYD
jgi:fructose-1,6-bisphosphatase II